MSHYAFLVLLLVLGSGTLYAIDISGTPDLTSTPTPRSTTGATDPAPVSTGAATEAPPAPTTTATNGTTPPAPAPTTVPANATTAAPPAPTTAPTNATTTAPPAPTTAPTNATTAAPPAPPTAPTNVTTAAPPAPPTAPANVTTTAPPAPTTAPTNVTTAAPPAPTTAPTNVTTAAPPAPTTAPTNVTTAAPPAPPTAAPSPMPLPSVGNYTVWNASSTACLMATMGLQIGYKDDQIFKKINLDPSTTVATGKCAVDGSDASLVLSFDKSSIAFTFREEGEKFHLQAVNVSLTLGTTVTFSAANANLSLWEASVGSSYMCRRDQSYNITDTLVLRTMDLQVQPYNVQKNSYATAEDCPADADESFIVPLIVGASLGVLTLIVLVAYLVGRSRSQNNGYQSL